MTIFELDHDGFGPVRPLFHALQHHPIIDSVIDGCTPGHLVVDDVECPRAACLWNRTDAVMMSGLPTGDEFDLALGRLVRQIWGLDGRGREDSVSCQDRLCYPEVATRPAGKRARQLGQHE
jgi:hypothetical protein